MVPKKNSVYNIKIFKQQPDDPVNNIIDAIGKISQYDTVSMIMPIKPLGTRFNKKAQRRAEGLYRNDKRYTDDTPLVLRILKALNPFHIIRFLISGPQTAANKETKTPEGGKDFVRMVKAKEDYLNAMGEEAALPFFETGMVIVTSSDDKTRLQNNLDMLKSAFTIYGDDYGNELVDQNQKHDLFGRIYKPLRRIGVNLKLTHFFFKKNIFGVNELASLFHFPDIAYNRSPIISWMQYKLLPAPENLPTLHEPNGFVITGRLAESYKNGNLSEILKEYASHRAVGKKNSTKEALQEITTQKDIAPQDIIEKDGKRFIKHLEKKDEL